MPFYLVIYNRTTSNEYKWITRDWKPLANVLIDKNIISAENYYTNEAPKTFAQFLDQHHDGEIQLNQTGDCVGYNYIEAKEAVEFIRNMCAELQPTIFESIQNDTEIPFAQSQECKCLWCKECNQFRDVKHFEKARDRCQACRNKNYTESCKKEVREDDERQCKSCDEIKKINGNFEKERNECNVCRSKKKKKRVAEKGIDSFDSAVCNECNEAKPRSEFKPRNDTPRGISHNCKNCINKHRKRKKTA